MRLSQAQINAYNDAMHAFQGDAEDYFRRLMGAYRDENPGASVAECREFCIVAMEEALGIYAPAAQELAAQLFDEVCEAEGIDARAELPADLYDRDMLVDAAHYNAGKLVEDAVAGWVAFVDAEARLANFYVRRSAYEAMKQSCKDGNVQWARVPTGRETCGYCFMLASRGFDYVSEDTAKAGSHVGCDCIVVPGKGGRTEIEGYHPEELYERWLECKEAAESTRYTDVIKEVETRDWDWVWTGKNTAPSGPLSRYKLIPSTNVGFSDAVMHSNRLDRFNAGDWAYMNNCQRCVVASEIRRRGYNVVARPAIKNAQKDDVLNNWHKLFVGQTWDRAADKASTDALIMGMPTGARGTVYIEWNPWSAHVFNFEKTSSGVKYYDAQTGSQDVAWYFTRQHSGSDILVSRTDNLEVDKTMLGKIVKRG